MNVYPELVLDGGAPICCQIEGQIRRFVLSGALRPGEELPTVRAVAVGLAVNPHAVEDQFGLLVHDFSASSFRTARSTSSGPKPYWAT